MVLSTVDSTDKESIKISKKATVTEYSMRQARKLGWKDTKTRDIYGQEKVSSII